MKAKIALFLFFVIALSGCVDLSQKNDPASGMPAVLEPSSAIKFSDVPVPVGFNILPQNSYSFETSGVRVGVLKYRGKASADQVVSFYKEQMPMYNWHLLNVIEFGERMLNFERENETCIVDLSPKGSSCFLTISLGPKSQITKKPKQPLK